MVIKETKIASVETNTEQEGNLNAAPTFASGDGEGLRNTGTGVMLKTFYAIVAAAIIAACLVLAPSSDAAGRGRCAVGDRQGRSRRCAAARRRLLGTAVALYGGQLPARYAQPARPGPRSALRSTGTPTRQSACQAGRCSGQAGWPRASAHRICSLPWYSPAGGENKTSRRIFLFFCSFYAPAAVSLRLEMERLDDRRPFLDVGDHQIGKVLPACRPWAHCRAGPAPAGSRRSAGLR